MFKDLEPELLEFVDDNNDEISVEIPEIEEIVPLFERFNSWLEIVDN